MNQQYPQYQQQQGYGASGYAQMQQGWVCPYCHAQNTQIHSTKVSTGGWILFVVLLITTCIGAPLGFLLRDHQTFCGNCYTKVS